MAPPRGSKRSGSCLSCQLSRRVSGAPELTGDDLDAGRVVALLLPALDAHRAEREHADGAIALSQSAWSRTTSTHISDNDARPDGRTALLVADARVDEQSRLERQLRGSGGPEQCHARRGAREAWSTCCCTRGRRLRIADLPRPSAARPRSRLRSRPSGSSSRARCLSVSYKTRLPSYRAARRRRRERLGRLSERTFPDTVAATSVMSTRR